MMDDGSGVWRVAALAVGCWQLLLAETKRCQHSSAVRARSVHFTTGDMTQATTNTRTFYFKLQTSKLIPHPSSALRRLLVLPVRPTSYSYFIHSIISVDAFSNSNSHVKCQAVFVSRTVSEMNESDQEEGQPLPLPLLRCKLVVAYNGSRFKGFQRQSSGAKEATATSSSPGASSAPEPEPEPAPASAQDQSSRKRRRLDKNPKRAIPLTIQECFEDAMEQYTGLDRNQLRMRFAGRTDGGVHARGQIVAISVPESVAPQNRDELWKIRKSINSRLPDDISVDSVHLLTDNPDFDPRKDAIKKHYSYTLKFRRKVRDSNGELLPICTSGPNCIRSGLDAKNLWISPWTLDDSSMERYCQQLTGEHDYSAFVHKRSRREKDNRLTVYKFTCEHLAVIAGEAPILTVRFHLEAKGFRRGMVRNLVGFVVDLCRGQLSESVFETIWSGTDEAAKAVNSAPPFGLCLESVSYSIL